MRLPTLQHPLEKQVMSSRELCSTRDFLQTHLQEPEFIFGSRVTGFSRDPSCWSIGSYIPFLQGSNMQQQYHRRTTLHTWPWKMQERDAEWSTLTIARLIHGASVPLGTIVTQRYDVLRDWLWDACHMAGVRWGSRCKGFCSKEGLLYGSEQRARNPTVNLIHEFGNPLGIPYLSCTVQLNEAYVMQENFSSRILVSKKGMICVQSNGCLHEKPLAKSGKGKDYW